jgi:hypothetical protein
MTRTSTKLFIAIATVALVGMVLCIFLYVRIHGHERVVAQSLGELEGELIREDQLKTIEGLMRDIESERATLDSQFLTEAEIVSFITLLESLDSYTGVSLEIDSVSKQGNTLNISLDATGSWESVYHLLAMIEALPPASIVNGITFGGNGGSEGLWSVSIDIETLLVPEASTS